MRSATPTEIRGDARAAAYLGCALNTIRALRAQLRPEYRSPRVKVYQISVLDRVRAERARVPGTVRMRDVAAILGISERGAYALEHHLDVTRRGGRVWVGLDSVTALQAARSR